MVKLKIRFDQEIRRFSIEKSATFKQLYFQLRRILSIPHDEDLVIKYIDDEGDKITISSDIELQEALACSKEPIQIFVSKIKAEAPIVDMGEGDSLSVLLESMSLDQSTRSQIDLQKIKEAEQREVEERRKLEEERRKLEEEKRREHEKLHQKLALEKAREEAERKRDEERRREEEKRAEEERKREIERRMEELKRREEEKKREEERKKRAAEEEDKKKVEEKKRIDEEKKRIEEELRRVEEEEKKRIEEEYRRKEAEERKRIEAEEMRRIEEQRQREEEEKKKAEEKKKINNWVQYKARNGRMVLLDLSDGALRRFGVTSHARVQTPFGFGIILGVDQEHHFLWFMLDRDLSSGASYWDDITSFETMIGKQIIPTGEVWPIYQPATEMAQIVDSSLFQDVIDPKEKELLMKAVQDSLMECRQKEIQTYYEFLLSSKK